MLALVVPASVSRAQDSTTRISAATVTTIEGGDAVAITSGAASIVLKKDGTIVLKGNVIVEDGKHSAPTFTPTSSRASEVF